MAAQEDFADLRQYFVDPIQHDYEVIRPIVLFAETAAERSRQTGVERTVVGDKARRFVLEGMDGLRDRRTEARGAQTPGYPDAIAEYILYWTLAFLAVLRWLTQQAIQDRKIITQFGRFLAGRL